MPINNYFETLQSKDIGWQIGLKTKTFLYVAYKRHFRAKDRDCK